MRLLLDTYVVLWQASGLRRLGASAQQAIADVSRLLVSVVSFAEVGVKATVGELSLDRDLHAHVVTSGARILPLAPAHGLAVAELPLHHRDPFDRLLIAQAIAEDLTVVTADPRFRAYGVLVVDALA
ncbi:type II toxin-antitoxin system VapC family toxin [Geodermatophilus sp. TF02-6]|uniref:type II toxin-antitoxin system VapC family toxin n=1 Tax=Geodermatophilus sp. TF02-6 TaxID=2250575 RepID=UPI000DE92239|nr:type II toxin-antitoxin system VapC family toxin [Geodermatophilus sp. TF02-6]RBY82988.1 type II toxin-antitoxin system VapC family toxin [Geodermatophilus sp. TF02-6]